MSTPDRTPIERAYGSLVALAVGDAIGEMLPVLPRPLPVSPGGNLPDGPWPYTDDTEMAIAIYETLAERGTIDGDDLARRFGERFAANPDRGYGAVAHWLLYRIHTGADWRTHARQPFQGAGSMGNGAAMRVAPLGAWFAGDPDAVVAEAIRSAEVTHAHPDGQAGAVAVAVAAATLAEAPGRDPSALFDAVLERTPDGPTREGLAAAAALLELPPAEAGERLGTGEGIISSDTVPFCLWCAARHPGDVAAALNTAAAGFPSMRSDRDTVFAIVAGIVGSGAPETVPALWRNWCERLPIAPPGA